MSRWRGGVRQLLAPHAEMTVAGESRNGLETLRALDALAPDLLFLDVQMPEMDGFEVLRAYGGECLAAERPQREKCGLGRLVVSTAAGDLVIPGADIDWISADDYYACLHVGAR